MSLLSPWKEGPRDTLTVLRFAPLTALAFVIFGGCSTPLNEFVCERTRDCVGDRVGQCEPSGHCSFSDMDCDSGSRFGENSGAESGLCVGEVASVADAAVPAPDVPITPALGWSRRRNLRFDNSGRDEEFLEFPVLVVLTPQRVDYSLFGDAGKDLRFTDSEGELIPYEIEAWDPAGSSYIWVRAPKIEASSADNNIFMYYSNDLATDAQDRDEVWSNGYEAVYHLSESGSSFANSAGSANPGTNTGSTQAQGAVGGGRRFDGVDDHIKLNDHQPMAMLQGAPGMTLTAWILPENLLVGNPKQDVLALSIGGGDCTRISRAGMSIDGNPDEELVLGGRAADNGINLQGRTTTVGLVEDEWYLISGVYDVDFLHGEDANRPYGRTSTVVNDATHASGGNARFTQAATAATMSQCGSIGGQDDASDDFFAGVIDEVRISNMDRSSLWLRAQYQSMRDQFVTYGDAQVVEESLGQ